MDHAHGPDEKRTTNAVGRHDRHKRSINNIKERTCGADASANMREQKANVVAQKQPKLGVIEMTLRPQKLHTSSIARHNGGSLDLFKIFEQTIVKTKQSEATSLSRRSALARRA